MYEFYAVLRDAQGLKDLDMRLGGWASDHIMKRHYLQSMHDTETAELVAASLSAVLA